jgi:ankyrin repeat protein
MKGGGMRINEELIMAIMKGDVNKAKQLVESGADVNAVLDERTPLHVAYLYRDSINNPFDLIDYLLRKGADINAGDCSGTTVLIMSVMDNEPLWISYFMSKGADPNVKDNFGDTAFTIARRDYEDIVKLLKSETDFEGLIFKEDVND